MKLNFLNSVAKFSELQGTILRIPVINRKYVDLYKFHRVVQQEGGFEKCCQERGRWKRVAMKMGCTAEVATASSGAYKLQYEKLLYPYDLFKSGVYDENGEKKPKNGRAARYNRRTQSDAESSEPPSESSSPQKVTSPRLNREAKQLKNNKTSNVPAKEQNVAKESESAPITVDQIICTLCRKGDQDDRLLLCDSCDCAYHTFCLIPPLPYVPQGDWSCPKCVSKELSKPIDPYGFLQSSTQYTLKTFGEMADSFKTNYFRRPLNEISTEEVEKEFWRLTKSIHEQVQVEYGADVHVLEMGSGFPVGDNKHMFPGEDQYADSPWNLNNMPLLPRSLLRFVTSEISGMKIPWCYAGMCFSCFCWHVEDHYTYSINYLHWGDPKTWYGVPSADADKLQNVVRMKAPELFEQSPDLMHQLTTIINPTVLQKHGVRVFRTDQQAGEFVVTFPRGYHAGFNCGLNFAEAVNFCLPDWLPFGRNAVEEYRKIRRHCVFSQEELLCKMAANPGLLDVELAAQVLDEFTMMVNEERNLRKAVFEAGIEDSSRELFEVIPDDDRQCCSCKSMLFLSAIICKNCSTTTMACIRHPDALPCACPRSNHKLLYRYTFDEMEKFIDGIRNRAEMFNSWMDRVSAALAPVSSPPLGRVDLPNLRKLLKESCEKKFPENHDLFRSLKKIINDADKAQRVTAQLLHQIGRAKTRLNSSNTQKITIEELKNFAEQYSQLPYLVDGIDRVKEIANQAQQFTSDVDILFNDSNPSKETLTKLLHFSETHDIQLPGTAKLNSIIERSEWLSEFKSEFGDYFQNNAEEKGEYDTVSLDTVERLLTASKKIVPNPQVSECIRHLQDLSSFGEHLEQECRQILVADPKKPLDAAGELIRKGSTIDILHSEALEELKGAVKKAKVWGEKLVKFLDKGSGSSFPPFLEALQVVEAAKGVPFKLDGFERLESQVNNATQFLEKCTRVFLTKGNNNAKLLEVLAPRLDIGIVTHERNISGSPRKVSRVSSHGLARGSESLIVTSVPKIDFSDGTQSSSELFTLYTQAAKLEVDAMIELRIANAEKIRRKSGYVTLDNGVPTSESSKAPIQVCICRKGPTAEMNVCALCKEWFHTQCMPAPKAPHSHAADCNVLLKFLCTQCQRTKRPKVDNVLALLLSLQRISLRIREGTLAQMVILIFLKLVFTQVMLCNFWLNV